MHKLLNVLNSNDGIVLKYMIVEGPSVKINHNYLLHALKHWHQTPSIELSKMKVLSKVSLSDIKVWLYLVWSYKQLARLPRGVTSN